MVLKHNRRFGFLLLLVAVLAGCVNTQSSEPVVAQVTGSPPPPIATLTYTPSPQPTATDLPPTVTPPATATQLPSPTATNTPTATPTPTITPTPTASPTATATPEIDRACNTPNFPNYDRFWLSGDEWPTPTGEDADHLWFGKPLPPGVGRLLYNRTYPYGFDGGRPGGLLLHVGVDVSEDLGTPILAIGDGTVVFARSDENELHGWRCNWYGQFVTILHDEQTLDGEPIYSLYGHVLNIEVEEGQRVERGDQVAELGFGGAATAWHLHLEIRVGENTFESTRNPMLWMLPGGGRGIIAGRLVDPRGHPWQGVPIFAESEDGEEFVTWTYLGDPTSLAQPDDDLAENFVFADLKAGTYKLYTTIQGVSYSAEIEVTSRDISAVEIETLPLKEATGTPDS